jgi:hypothetical protein
MSESSKASAARFFALKSGRKVKLAALKSEVNPPRKERPRGELRQPVDLRSPPEQWRFVEKSVPGCFAAWVATVGIRTEGLTLGVTGKPSRVNAIDESCYLPGYTACRCHVFSGGTWQKRCHPIVECCARKVFGDGLHAPDCSRAKRVAAAADVTAIVFGPQIEERRPDGNRS